jgi:hypothetical protein
MFKVLAGSLEEYLSFDPKRRGDLEQLDALIRQSAPSLKRYFQAGTPPGEPGMRFKMVGYGAFHFPAKAGKQVQWPVIGVALQKSYITAYFAVTVNNKPIVDSYVGKLGELRAGVNNFSFRTFSELNTKMVFSLFQDAADVFARDPQNPIRNAIKV